MKNYFTFFAASVMMTAAMLMGCSDDPIEPPIDSDAVVNLESTTVDVEAEGGAFTMNYSVENAISGVTVLAECEQEWITIGEVTESVINFAVAINDKAEAREAVVTVKYPSAADVSFAVKQAGMDDEQLSIAIKDLGYNTFTSVITPVDDQMTYVVYMSEVAYFLDQGIATEEDLVYDDISFFMQYAGYYGQSLDVFMFEQGFAQNGESEIAWSGVVPAGDFVVYAYGIEFNEDKSDYTKITPIYYEIVETPINEIGETQFDINIEINGPDVTYTVTPEEGYNGHYTLLVYGEMDEGMYLPEGSSVDDAYTVLMAQSWMTTADALMGYYEMTIEQVYEQMCFTGVDSFSETLSANAKYMAIVFAVDEVDGLPMLVSKPVVKHFTTGDVVMSDMTFEVDLEEVYSRVVKFTVTPSSLEETYTIFVPKSEELGDMTDEEIVEWATTTYWLNEYSGVYTYNDTLLQPDTEYSILIFGFYAEAATTALTRIDFKTEPAAPAENKITKINMGGPYDPVAIAELNPDVYGSFAAYAGYFVMWFEGVAESDEHLGVSHYLYDTATIADYGDEGIFDDLISYYYNPIEVGAGEFGVEYKVAAVVQDKRGNHSDVFYSEPFTYSTGDLRDAQEFIDVMSGETRSKSRSVVLVGRDKCEEPALRDVLSSSVVYNAADVKSERSLPTIDNAMIRK